jgi:NitT/TauT family transport system substrate-binding protein
MKLFSLVRWLLALVALCVPVTLGRAQPPAEPGAGADAELVETRREVPKLAAPAPYVMKDNTVRIELSNYAGYAGLIAANHGLKPSEDSVFFKKHGFKVELVLSEEESWSALNSGKMAASATTADVLAAYGKQFDVVVPALIGFSRGADGIVVRSDIKRVNDLKGKVLSTCQFTESDFFLRYLAQEAGLEVNLLDDLKSAADPNKVNVVACADGFGAGDLFLRDVKAGKKRLAGCVTWAPKTTEVAQGSSGLAHVLTTNKNLLIVADVLIVNKGFARANPQIVTGLVEGLLEGNAMVRTNPKAHLSTIVGALEWKPEEAESELAKVHLANGPENLAFFDGTIDSAGSWGYIYETAASVYASIQPNRVEGERFLELKALNALKAAGAFKDQKAQITPIRSALAAAAEDEPLLSKNFRFLFEPNSSKLQLDAGAGGNQHNIDMLAKALQVSPGSTILLRGHAENTLIEQYRKEGGDALVRQVALSALQLSKDRAAEVKRILIERAKIDPDRVRVVGRGWEEPLPNTPPAENRRVEMQWFTVE